MKTIILLLISVAIWCAKTPTVKNNLIPNWATVAQYDVLGTSGPELRSQMDAFGPFDSKGLRHDAYTTWTIRWVIPGDKVGQAKIDGITLDLKAIVVVPRLHPDAKIDEKLRTEWDAFIEKLKEHEAKHIAISENCIADMKNRLKTYKGTDPNAMLNAIVSKYRQIETDMDIKSNNGRNDGVKFY